ncbi:hypothetical protein [Aureispira anguillae]|uniref:Uncharacterized protein n=1 Tax=Aureispira anguillae TaxID=2864201 RepID=A0A915YD84_9BACT|nr:hypothetical protein [Aureispira anguillae]BDS10927.1 hypothetical protein AsAng_0016370 [Aureispira anguillae]
MPIPLLIPIVAAGAGATGYWWITSKAENKEPSFTSELLAVLQPLLIIIVILFGLRWLYQQGNSTTKKNIK